MKKQLSKEERLLLHALIHDDSDDWWKVVPNQSKRNAALDSLLDLNLIEVRKKGEPKMRATKRGHISNAKLLASGWVYER